LRSEDKPQLSPGDRASESAPAATVSAKKRRARKGLATGLAGLIAVPVLLLAACGNAEHKISNDLRPDPRASTEGGRQAYPEPIESGSVVKPTPMSGVDKQQAPVDPDPINAVPPEDLVSQQGAGYRDN
jgi:hypothetical protein